MDLTRTGRILYSASMIAFGVLMAMHGSILPDRPLAGPWVMVGPVEGWFVGAALVACGLGITLDRFVRPASLLLGGVIVLVACVHYVPGLIMTPRGGGNWTRGFEALAMSGAAIVLAVRAGPATGRWERLAEPGLRIGRCLFAISLGVFGTQHIIYDELTAGVIKPWMPWRMLWVYVVAAGFFAAALAIIARRVARLATWLLGGMFASFALLVHVPDVIASPGALRQWTNVFIALSMSGGALMLSGSFGRRDA